MSDNILESTEYVRVDVIAQLFGVTARRIQQLTQDGVLPTTNAPGEKKTKCYELVPTIQRYVQYLSDKAAGRRSDPGSEAELKAQKLKAEIRLKESQAELHSLKTEIAAGKYLSLEEVRLDYGRFLTNFKKMALALPGRITGIISAVCDPVQVREIENDLNSEIVSVLNTFVLAAEAGETSDGGEVKTKKSRKKKVDDQEVPG